MFALILAALIGPTPALAQTTMEGPVRRSLSTSLTEKPVRLRTQADIAWAHAPVHYQDTDATDWRADLLSTVDYDGEWDTTNNWGHYDDWPLTGAAYYSVVETCTHWFVLYGFYHPRDWVDGWIGEEHENDFEGLLLVVEKDETDFGTVVAAVTIAHDDFHSYVPYGSSLVAADGQDVGTLWFEYRAGHSRPRTFQESQGHGLYARTGDFPGGDGVVYVPTGASEGTEPPSGDSVAEYALVDMFTSLWDIQLDEGSPDNLAAFAGFGALNGDQGGSCGEGWFKTCKEDAAHMPWRWDDLDDDRYWDPVTGWTSRLPAGMLALDPATLVDVYFDGFSRFSHDYVSNTYAENIAWLGEPDGWPNDLDLAELSTRLHATCK